MFSLFVMVQEFVSPKNQFYEQQPADRSEALFH